ncbi:MAG: hypothetical protein ACFE8O_12085 [Candidatus Hermodarchaeota archaeon]
MSTNDKVFIKEIGKAYRFGFITQAMLFISIVVITIIVLEFLPLTFEAKITAFVVISTFLFPLIVKKRNRTTRAISLGLFLSSMSLMIYYTLVFVLPLWPITQTTTLLVASFIAISILLFQYLMPNAIKRNTPGYVIIAIISLAFTTLTIMSFNLFPPFGTITVWSIVIFAAIAIPFTYAILPEKPI